MALDTVKLLTPKFFIPSSFPHASLSLNRFFRHHPEISIAFSPTDPNNLSEISTFRVFCFIFFCIVGWAKVCSFKFLQHSFTHGFSYWKLEPELIFNEFAKPLAPDPPPCLHLFARPPFFLFPEIVPARSFFIFSLTEPPFLRNDPSVPLLTKFSALHFCPVKAQGDLKPLYSYRILSSFYHKKFFRVQ